MAVMCLALVFSGCSNEEQTSDDTITDNPDVEKNDSCSNEEQTPDVEKVDSLELFYKTRTFGYRVKDTTNLDLITLQNLYGVNDTIFLSGRRDLKLWFAAFNPETKEQLYEFVDTEKLDLKQNIHIGYGEYVNSPIEEIDIVQIIDKKDDVYNFNLKCGVASRSIVLFMGNDHRKIYSYDNTILLLSDWYNHSLINSVLDQPHSTIFDTKGKILFDKVAKYRGQNGDMAVSYTDYIWIGFLFPTADTQPTILRTWLGDHSMNTSKWRKWLSILKEKNAKYDYTVISKTDEIWQIRFDITEFSGEKHTKTIAINIETGEIQG